MHSSIYLCFWSPFSHGEGGNASAIRKSGELSSCSWNQMPINKLSHLFLTVKYEGVLSIHAATPQLSLTKLGKFSERKEKELAAGFSKVQHTISKRPKQVKLQTVLPSHNNPKALCTPLIVRSYRFCKSPQPTYHVCLTHTQALSATLC